MPQKKSAKNKAITTGPFGFHMAMTKADVIALGGIPIPQAYSEYHLLTPPRPHPRFESFGIYTIGDGHVVGVRAVGRAILTNTNGEAIRAEFYRLYGALVRKYGAGDQHDVLLPGSITRERAHWTYALLKKERTLNGVWPRDRAGPTARLAADLAEMTLRANMTDTLTGYMTLAFWFVNSDAYLSEECAHMDKLAAEVEQIAAEQDEAL